mmetsp:Transcript_7274/g.11048  ORF Transcript_7274/g.11048 Transcript_7274/m.11048 type:complete len:655 (+) Transcript_7274:148-2112(+)
MLRLATSTAARKLTAFSVVGATGSFIYHDYSQNPQRNMQLKTFGTILSKPLATSSHSSEVDLNSLLDPYLDKAFQLKPIMEASVRALRLIQTVLLVISDYKIDEYKSLYEQQTQNALKAIGVDSSLLESTNLNTIKHFEKRVQRRAQELQDAQNKYTGSDSPGNDIPGESRSERIERQRKAVLEAARQLADAEEVLASAQRKTSNETKEEEVDNTIHARAARRLRDLCRKNGGTYIKVGQHLANLDHLLPPAYIDVLHSLFGDAPTTEYNNVREVIREELGEYPEALFDQFDQNPIASASLAQVHVAKRGETKVAIKVQHRGLRETSKGDLLALEYAVRIVDRLFDEFKWGWIVDEIAPNLPKELDFQHEGRNAEAAADHIKKAGLGSDCVVPKVHWDMTTPRVLVMDFEEGHSATDVAEIENAGVCKRELAVLISSVFQSQIFQSGHIHCDPHPANVYWRKKKNRKPQLVLFDHGLYKQIDNDFRLTYARLWKSLMIADIDGIKSSCSSLGVREMYPLLAAMLTSRPFDEVMERSKSKSLEVKHSMDSKADAAMIRGYAQQYLKEIIQMLDKVPRQMLLLFKMNDCLRHIDHALGSPANTIVVAGKYATQTVYDSERDATGLLGRIRLWMSHVMIMLRIRAFELISTRQYLLS